MDDKQRNLSPRDFEFVQAEQKIYDKKFETKPIGYFRDAMIRFGKNKTNVVATSILFLIILGTIFIPIFSTKNYTDLEAELAFLPPRVPILENFGFLDGTSEKEGLPIDPATIDPETGLGIPFDYRVETIEMDTLENYTEPCADRSVLCVGGVNTLRVDSGADFAAVNSVDFMTLTEANNPYIEIVVTEFVNDSNSTLTLLIKPEFSDPFTVVMEITEAGTYQYYPFDEFTDLAWPIVSQVRLELEASSNKDYVSIASVAAYDDTQDEAIFMNSGFALASWTLDDADDAAGLWVRADGEITMARFIFNDYLAALGPQDRTIPRSEFDEILEEYADVCVATPHPDSENYPNGLVFAEGCPIIEVRDRTEAVIVNDEEKFSYFLTLDYAIYQGYDEIPYYYFGTDFNGRDLFTLLWVATRTSLLLGVVVATINVSIGIVYGAVSGYYGGTVDIILQRITEVIGRIPWLVTLAIFVSFFGPGIQTLILILIVSGWIGPQSVTRTQFYRYKGREYVLASRTLGAKDGRLIFRHILPNGIGTIITASILTIPYTIFAESTISYLGFGVGHGQSFNVFGLTFSGVSVGVLLSDGRNYLLDRPYITVFPALLISILMITFNMFGNALRDAFNPALRGSE
jgi:ABC-type dipeptide/oligopeptide/nickel transport system permease subunit